MLKRMKKQLNEASDYHHQKVTELDQREKCEVSGILKMIIDKLIKKRETTTTIKQNIANIVKILFILDLSLQHREE